jgi:hypothetical protein
MFPGWYLMRYPSNDYSTLQYTDNIKVSGMFSGGIFSFKNLNAGSATFEIFEW